MKCEFLRISPCAQILVLEVQQVNFLFVSLSFLHGKELKIAVGAKRGKQKERRKINYQLKTPSSSQREVVGSPQSHYLQQPQAKDIGPLILM